MEGNRFLGSIHRPLFFLQFSVINFIFSLDKDKKVEEISPVWFLYSKCFLLK